MDPNKRDEVGKTGIYPATGPYPPGEVEVITPEEINRGETGEEDTEEEFDEPSDALGG